MENSVLIYSGILLGSVFVSAISQVMLKISASRPHESAIREYANPLVVGAYALFVVSTLLTVFAYREVPLSLGPVYVTIFGALIFHERVTAKKLLALALIVGGICTFALLG